MLADLLFAFGLAVGLGMVLKGVVRYRVATCTHGCAKSIKKYDDCMGAFYYETVCPDCGKTYVYTPIQSRKSGKSKVSSKKVLQN
jgi:hypothetical protein